MGISTVFKLGVLGLLLSAVPLYLRYNDIDKLDCKGYELPPPPALSGPLSINNGLQNVEYILKDQIDGPESIVVDGNVIYTGLYDGRIVKIVNGKVVKSVSLTKQKACGNYESEPRCGRPLGLRLLSAGRLVVADAYLGLFIVDVDKGTSQQVYKSSMPIAGARPRFLNDVDVLNEDELLVSDSSVKWERRHAVHVIMENGRDGRVFRYRISTGEATVLVDGISFANGVQLMPNKESFLVAELGMARILRHYISGPKKGTTEVFAENLPGMPDNVRLSRNKTVWVGFAGIRHSGGASFLDRFASLPHIRQFLIDVIPAKLWLRLLPALRPAHSLVVQLDLEGNIVSSLHDTSGSFIDDVSQVTDGGSHLYLGSFHAKYIAKIRK